MGKPSKREISISFMKENEELFQCPICKSRMTIQSYGGITCPMNHSFDVAKQGHVNFLTKPVNSMYSKELFESRKEVIQSGLYELIHEKIAIAIDKNVKTILDTGCGEGSHLVKIVEKRDTNITSVGIDISKEGILTAAKSTTEMIWCVGDLTRSPFQEKSFDVILNFLSPANYDEFKRLLKRNGMVIKVIPQENYLREIRRQAFAHSEKEQYSNLQTVERFKEYFNNVQIQRVTYTVPLERQLVPKLLEMTPLGWHINEENKIDMNEITIDLDIMIGHI
nr:methyltransferase domain-containing protein [Lysinibacillus timonensis]